MLTATKDMVRRVSRGAALLDEVNPGWEHGIDLSSLDTSQVDDCVLGQLYGGFDTGATILELAVTNHIYGYTSYGPICKYGFSEPYSCRDVENYEILDALWAEEIYERLAEN